MRNFEVRAALALLCVALLLVLVGRPGHIEASGISSPSIWGRGGSPTAYGNWPIIACGSSLAFTAPGNATTLLLAGVPATSIYVCAFQFSVSVQNTTKFVRGTGALCGTGTLQMTGPYMTLAGVPIGLGSDLGVVMATQPGEDMCLTATNAASSISGFLAYTVF